MFFIGMDFPQSRLALVPHIFFYLLNFKRLKYISDMNNHHTQPSSLPSTSTSTSSHEKRPRSNARSRQAKDKHNKKRHQKFKEKRQQYTIKRKVYFQWSPLHVKQYLRSRHIKIGCVLPIFKKIVRLQFNNEKDKILSENQLSMDIFNEDLYREFINNQQA